MNMQKEDYEAYKKLMHDYPTLIKNNLNKNKVWVIGEKSYKAKIMAIISLNI